MRKGGNLTELMSKADPLFMGKAIIKKQPSTKVRDQEKRDKIIAIECTLIKDLTKDLTLKRVGNVWR